MKKRWTSLGLKLVGFLCIYIVPILLFSGVMPFLHGDISAGVTYIGYVGFALIAIFSWHKFMDFVKKQPESVWRAVVLCITPVVVWCVVKLGLNHIGALLVSLISYWDKVLLFVVLGCLCNVFAARIATREDEEGNNGK
ncbi:MAG: hypothetical protein IJW83_00135 [Clostridia bacterium]|nr:hypothetical protein [Clostridia bacterium]